jgi:hypothetical protein
MPKTEHEYVKPHQTTRNAIHNTDKDPTLVKTCSMITTFIYRFIWKPSKIWNQTTHQPEAHHSLDTLQDLEPNNISSQSSSLPTTLTPNQNDKESDVIKPARSIWWKYPLKSNVWSHKHCPYFFTWLIFAIVYSHIYIYVYTRT